MPDGDASILVVDDDEDVRQQCEVILSSEGMRVDSAMDGAEALEKVRECRYDVALVDLKMPRVDGLELLARIHHTCPEIGTVIMTSYPTADTATEAMQCGALDYLAKPVKPTELVTVVRRALEAKERERAQAAAITVEPGGDLAPSAVAGTLAERISVSKATLPWVNVAILGILAGAYIGFGAALATLVTSDAGGYFGFGVTKLFGGLVFSVGLILVVVAGAELFTGNNLMVAGALGRQLTLRQMLLRWTAVYFANFAGSLLLVAIMFGSGLWQLNDGGVGLTAIKIANAKVSLTFCEALCRGIGCNWLVCLAVWMSIAARQTSGKILAIVFPITAFVALGYEHCVANMYFIPMGIWLGGTELAVSSGLDLSGLTWSGFLVANLVPVTIGNIIGGAIFVGVLYWIAYLRGALAESTPRASEATQPPAEATAAGEGEHGEPAARGPA